MGRIFSFTFKSFFTFLFILSLSFLCVLNSYASGFQENTEEIYYLKDNAYSIDQISKQEFQLLKHSKLGIDNGIYWFRVQLNPSLKGQEIVLDFNEPSLGLIEVYNQKNLIANSKENQIGDWNSAILLKSDVLTYYLKVDFEVNTNFPLQIYTLKEYGKIKSRSNFLKGMYYGFVCMVFILNLFFFFRMKEHSFLYYCFFLLVINMAIAMYDGAMFSILSYPDHHYVMIALGLLIPLSGALFATHFLQLTIYFPKSKWVAVFLFSIVIFFYWISIYTDELLYYAIADLTALGILAYYWLLGVLIYKKHEFAKFFVIGYSLILASSIFFAMPLDFGINYIDLSINHVKFGALFETLILTYAISYRIKIMQEENESYRLKISTYLSKINDLREENKNVTKEEEDPELLQLKIRKIAQENQLTDREEEVLTHLSKNRTNQQIADALFVSVNTIKYHTRNIYQKLDLSNKKEVLTLFN